MKAAYITRTGAPDVIQYGDVPTPEPRHAEVLIRVGAVSVNPIDTYVRSGAVRKELPKPYIVGADFAGEIIGTGPDASRFETGQRVWGCNWHEPCGSPVLGYRSIACYASFGVKRSDSESNHARNPFAA